MPILIEASNTEWVWGKQAVRELLRTNPLQVKQVWLSPVLQRPDQPGDPGTLSKG